MRACTLERSAKGQRGYCSNQTSDQCNCFFCYIHRCEVESGHVSPPTLKDLRACVESWLLIASLSQHLAFYVTFEMFEMMILLVLVLVLLSSTT